MRTTHALRGRVAELLYMAHAIDAGFDIAVPEGSGDAYDLLVDFGNGWRRVQVKRAYRRKGKTGLYANTRPRKGKYDPTSADYLAVVNADRTGVALGYLDFKSAAKNTQITIRSAKYYAMEVWNGQGEPPPGF